VLLALWTLIEFSWRHVQLSGLECPEQSQRRDLTQAKCRKIWMDVFPILHRTCGAELAGHFSKGGPGLDVDVWTSPSYHFKA